MNLLTIVGCGPGSAELITLAGKRAIAEANIVIGAKRLLDVFAPGKGLPCPVRRQAALQLIESLLCKGDVCLLVSGDVGCFSLSATLREHIHGSQIRMIPGVSSVQVTAARMDIDWAGARVVTVDGHNCALRCDEIAREERTVALLEGPGSKAWLSETQQALSTTHSCWLTRQLSLSEVPVLFQGETLTTDTHNIAIFLKESS